MGLGYREVADLIARKTPQRSYLQQRWAHTCLDYEGNMRSGTVPPSPLERIYRELHWELRGSDAEPSTQAGKTAKEWTRLIKEIWSA